MPTVSPPTSTSGDGPTDAWTRGADLAQLGPRARAATAADAAAESDVAFAAFRYAPDDSLPVEELAGKVVLDNNNHMIWRDGMPSTRATSPRTPTPTGWARYIMTVVIGLAVQAANGVAREDLDRVVDATLHAWPM
ncbi:hypothetical protein F6B41_07010 [Microbacterium lushaniae]|nr:hypothetical protein F6B41_14800 [Microbacterium lushaniae]KAA9156820.1 hypothetical protein F6B41_07010 [Microbacterium lushaniae]